MNREQYARWWDDNTNAAGELITGLSEPERTLARHVVALQDRIDQLMHPDDHDQLHGHQCRCTFVQCACAYDHPDAVCMVHEDRCPQCGGVGGNHNAVLLSDKS